MCILVYEARHSNNQFFTKVLSFLKNQCLLLIKVRGRALVVDTPNITVQNSDPISDTTHKENTIYIINNPKQFSIMSRMLEGRNNNMFKDTSFIDVHGYLVKPNYIGTQFF